MTWQIQFDEQRKVIRLTFEAEISSEEVRESSIAVIAMVHDKETADILSRAAAVRNAKHRRLHCPGRQCDL